jgi:uncharacterized OsmC-like protein
MEVEARLLGDVKFEVTARGHRIVCDQPRENGGADSGMMPPEFLLTSLATCAGYYAAQYLKARGLAGDGLTVRVVVEKAMRPARLDGFRIEVTVPGIEERHREGLLRAVKACLVYSTLLSSPHIDVNVMMDSVGEARLESGVDECCGTGARG